MNCNVLKVELSEPEDGFFGSKYCKDNIRYVTLVEEKKPLSWCLGINEFSRPVIWQVGLFYPQFDNFTHNFSITSGSAKYINDGSLDWDELSLSVNGFLESATQGNLRGAVADFVSFSKLKFSKWTNCAVKGGFFGSSVKSVYCVLGKDLKAEDLDKEIKETFKISNYVEFVKIFNSVAVYHIGNDSFASLTAIAKDLFGENLSIKSNVQLETHSQAYYKQKQEEYLASTTDKNSKLIPISFLFPKLKSYEILSLKDIVGTIKVGHNKYYDYQSFSLVDSRSFFRSVTTKATSIDTNSAIYFGKVPDNEKMSSTIMLYRGPRNQQENGSYKCLGLAQKIGNSSLYNFSNVVSFVCNNKGNKSSSNSIFKYDKSVSNAIIELVKLNSTNDNSRNTSIARNVKISTLDNLEATCSKYYNNELWADESTKTVYLKKFSANLLDSTNWVPIRTPVSIVSASSSYNIEIPIVASNRVTKYISVSSDDIDHQYSSICYSNGFTGDFLNKIDEIITVKITSESGLPKWKLLNKTNLKVEEKRAGVSKKIESLYFAIEKALRFNLRAILGFPKIPRCGIINGIDTFSLRARSDVEECIEKLQNKRTSRDITLAHWKSNNQGGHNSCQLRMSAYDIPYILNLAMVFGSFKSLEKECVSRLKGYPSATDLYIDLAKENGINFELEEYKSIGLNFEDGIGIVDVSLFYNSVISSLLSQVVIWSSIENSAIFNVDGSKNTLVSPKDIIADTMSRNTFSRTTFIESIYA